MLKIPLNLRARILIILFIVSTSVSGQHQLFEQLTKKDGLGSNNVYSIKLTPDGEIWLTTDQHLCLFQGLGFSSFQVNDSSLIGLFLDPSGRIYTYTSGGKIYHFDGVKTKQIVTGIESELQTNLINQMVFENNSKFWSSSIVNGEMYSIEGQNGKLYDVPKTSGYFIKELNNGTFICGTGANPSENNQVVIQFIDEKVTIPYTQKGPATKSTFLVLNDSTYLFAKDFELIHFDRQHVLNRVFVEKNITSLYQDSKGKIWLGLYNGGIVSYPNSKLSAKEQVNYLGGISITAIEEDFSNNLWIGTLNNGVYYLPAQQSVKYTAPHLFSDTGKTSTTAVGIQTKNTSDTVSSPDLRVISTQASIYDSIPPTIYISNVRIMNRDTTINELYELPYNMNFLNINYIGFSYKDPENIQYRYKMFGLDKEWTYTNNSSVQYTTLPPGEYQFIVSSMNKNGIWSETPARIKLKITPPFWETWWFLLISILLVSIMSGGFLYLWIRNIKEKERAKLEVEKKIASVELQALRAQMNPHFMFNTMSSIQHFITTNETESALKYLSKFSKLMRKILDNSKKPRVTVIDEIEALELYLSLETLRFKDKLSYSIDVDSSIDQNYDEIPAMLIQPYVENAILHGINHKEESGKISIALIRENEFIKCTIEDDGIGRERSEEINKSKNKKHQSAGMSITKERLSILNQAHGSDLNVTITDLTNSENNPCGTRVEIYIPSDL